MSALPGFTSRLFLSGSLAFVAIGVLGAAYGVSLPAFTRAFGLAPGQASLILPVQAAGAVAMVAAGTMGLRGLTARLSALLMVAGAGLIAAGIAWPLTLLGAFVAGSGFGITATYVNRAFLQGFGPRGAGMLGLVNAISAVGLIAGPLIYVGVGGSVRLLFGAISVLAAVTLLLYRPRDDSFAGAPRGLPDLGPRRLGFLAMLTACTMMETALGGLGAVALIASGWAEDRAALLVSGFFTAFLLARLSLYWLSRMVGPDRLFLIGVAGTALAAGLAAAGAQAPGYVLAGGFNGIAFPAFYVWGARVLGDDPRMGSSMVLAGLLGGVLGPFAFAALLRIIGLPLLFAAVAVTGAILSLAAARVILRPAPPAPAGT